MQTLTKVASVTVAAAAFGVGIGHLVRAKQLTSEESVPVTVVYRLRLIDGDGAIRAQQTKIVAQWANGSRAEILQTAGVPTVEGAFETRTIYDVSNRQILTWLPHLKTRHTLPMDDQTAAVLTQPKRGCEGMPASEQLLGYTVVYSRSESRYDTDQRLVVERRLAPALGCLMLTEVKQVFSSSGASLTVNSLEAEAVLQGQPDPGLLRVAPDAKETVPSESIKALSRLRGRTEPACTRTAAELADEAYERRRSR